MNKVLFIFIYFLLCTQTLMAQQSNEWQYLEAEEVWVKPLRIDGPSVIVLFGKFENTYDYCFQQISECPIDEEIETLVWVPGQHVGVSVACDGMVIAKVISDQLANALYPMPYEMRRIIEKEKLERKNMMKF